MDSESDELYYSKLSTKGKRQILSQKLEILKLTSRRRRQGKCVGAALESSDLVDKKVLPVEVLKNQETYAFISNDIWFHLANYIVPEEVQRYSLICSQSANSVNSRLFWLQLYRRYCQKASCNEKKWNLQLPGYLQMENIKNCDRNTLRQKVIQALFYCYPPFERRLHTPSNLDTLIGRNYVASWHKPEECGWMFCFKFKYNFLLNCRTAQNYDCELEDKERNSVVDNWECLADAENNNFAITQKSYSCLSFTSAVADDDINGTILLVINCERFTPFPSDIVYNHGSSCPFRLTAIRNLLSTDMVSTNLQLDFAPSTGDQAITVVYTKTKKFTVLPWWHPDFRNTNNCA